jgi:polygalacturonase
MPFFRTIPLLVLTAACVFGQDRRNVTEPVIPPVCISLDAANAWPLDESRTDTARIQAALDQCPAGRAVQLLGRGVSDAFLSGPLHLRSGVTLLVARGVTLYASRNPRDFEVSPGSCGIITEKGHGCRALLNGNAIENAGVMGEGVIDGRGGSPMTGSQKTWWQLAEEARAGGSQNVPRIIVLNGGRNFTLYRITLRNSANFHVAFSKVNGFTAWDVKIHSPKRARNTDGGGSPPLTNVTISHNHFYSGHGMSIGSETDAGASAIRVNDLTIDHADNGIRIKSNASRGGLVRDVVYEDICIRDTDNPLLFDTHYPGAGKVQNLIPRFEGITLRNISILGGGKLTFDGFDPGHPLRLAFDRVNVADPAHTQWIARNLEPAVALDDLAHASGPSCTDRFQPFPAPTVPLRVAADGSGDFATIQQAVDAAGSGATILVAPGVYREKVIVKTASLTIRGAGKDPAATEIVLDQSAGSTGSTFRSATVEVRAPDFHASNITFANDFNRTHEQVAQGSQALALLVNRDRAVFRHVRLLGNQDTLYVASANCNPDGNPCTATRQYFADCYIEGNVDFIFGDAKTYFDRCEIRSTAHQGGYVTAQGKHYAAEDSGFVFRDCRLTAEPGVAGVYLGRPWRAFASVVFLNTNMGAHIAREGWREWHPGETSFLNTVFYAEAGSSGPGGTAAGRDPHTHFLAVEEARRYLPATFLGGGDNWNPERIP